MAHLFAQLLDTLVYLSYCLLVLVFFADAVWQQSCPGRWVFPNGFLIDLEAKSSLRDHPFIREFPLTNGTNATKSINHPRYSTSSRQSLFCHFCEWISESSWLWSYAHWNRGCSETEHWKKTALDVGGGYDGYGSSMFQGVGKFRLVFVFAIPLAFNKRNIS